MASASFYLCFFADRGSATEERQKVGVDFIGHSIDEAVGFAVVLQQFGSMNGETTLYYEFAPGSGSAELAGLIGTVEIDTSAPRVRELHRLGLHRAGPAPR